MKPKLPKRSVITWRSLHERPDDGFWLLLRWEDGVTFGFYDKADGRFHVASTAAIKVLRWAYLPK